MKTIGEKWDYEQRLQLIETVDKALNEGITTEVAFQIAKKKFQKPVEQCKHVYNMVKNTEKSNKERKRIKKTITLNNDELFNAVIKYYETGTSITQSIKSVCDDYNLNFGSTKSRWYKLLKTNKEFSEKFEYYKDQVTKDSRKELETEILQNQKEVANPDLININIEFFNKFYLEIKDKPEILSNLIIYKDLKSALEESRKTFRQIETILDKLKD